MEMLIVVAIIVILVAIAFPMFSSQLDKAKESTDAANLRAAKAVAAADYMLDEGKVNDGDYYNLETGEFQDEAPTEAYGESTANDGKVIQVTITEDGEVTVAWTTPQ